MPVGKGYSRVTARLTVHVVFHISPAGAFQIAPASSPSDPTSTNVITCSAPTYSLSMIDDLPREIQSIIAEVLRSLEKPQCYCACT